MAKFCTNCGTQMEDNQTKCMNCGKEVGGTTTSSEAQSQTTNTSTTYQPKSRIAAGVLGLFLGAFGVHNFYLGYTGKAIAQLLLTLLSCGLLSFVSGIWSFIEAILILCGSINVDGQGHPLID